MKKLALLLVIIGLFACKKDPVEVINVPVDKVITGNITTTTTLTADKEWTLKGYVYVKEGTTLIIQPGTVIKSDIA
jgi:hypothetical protein